MKFSFSNKNSLSFLHFIRKSIALPCLLLVNLNKSMGLRLEFAIRNMRLCCTLAHCSTSTSVKTNRPIGHPQKKPLNLRPQNNKVYFKKNGHFSKVPWPDLAPVCFFPGTKCTISPTYIIAINLESEMFRQTKFVKIGQLDFWEDFTPRTAPPHPEKISSARPAPPRSKKGCPVHPNIWLYHNLHHIEQHWYFCWLSDFHFHSSLNIGFLWSPHRLSRTEAFQCTTSAGWLFLQILYKKSSKRKLLFNFCSPRRPCNKNKIDWNNGMWPWPSHRLTDGGQPSKTIENHGWGTQFSKFWPLFQSRIRENCNIKTKSNAMCERRGLGELSEG